MLSEPQCHQFKMSVVSLPGGYNTVAHRCAIETAPFITTQDHYKNDNNSSTHLANL